MIEPKLQVMSDLGTGTVLDTLRVLSATTTDQVDGNDSSSFRIALPTKVPISLRTPLRFRGTDNITREYRVRRYLRDPAGRWGDIEGAPPFVSLSTGGLIRQIINGTLYTTFAGTLTASQWISTYVLTNLTVDGHTWLDSVLGTINSTQLVTLSFSQWTRAELLRALADALGLDLVLIQNGVGGLYRIHLLTERGSDVAPIRMAKSGALMKLSVDSNDEGLATIVQPLGDVPEGGTEPASIAKHSFIATSIASGWVTIVDASNTAKPIAFDDMVNGLYLQFLSGTTQVRRLVGDSRASDGACFLSDTSLLTLGASVTFVQDVNGTPLDSIRNPAAVAQLGPVSIPIQVTGMRGEANRVQNANFAAGASQWTPVSSGWHEPYVPTENTDLVGAMNGSKTAGVPATLSVDGLPNSCVVRRGERIEVASVLLATTSSTKTVPSTGNVTLPLSGTLAQNVASLAQFRTYDSNGMLYPYAIAANGSGTAGATTLAVSSPSMANRKLTVGDQIRFTHGGTYNGLISVDATTTNATGSDITWTVTLTMSQALTNISAVPSSPTLADGDALSFQNVITGQSITGVANGTYAANAATISVRIIVPANTTYLLPANQVIIFTTQISTETKAVTNSATEWPDNKQIAFTWTGGLALTGASSVEWLDAGGAQLGILTQISGVTAGSTSATLQYDLLKQITTGTKLYSTPETLYCSSAIVANGSGAVVIPLISANVSALADNAVVRIIRNTQGWVDQGAGSQTLLRASTGWITSETVIPVAVGKTQIIWAQFAAQFWHSGNDYTAGAAPKLQLDIVNAATGAVLVSGVSDPQPLTTLAGQDRPQAIACIVKVQCELTATTRIKVVATPINGVGTLDFSTKGYAMASYAMLTEGSDPNVPFTASAHPNLGWQTGVRYLQVYAKEVRTIACSAAQLADIPGAQIIAKRVACGVRINLIDTGDSLRAMAYTRDHLSPQRSVFTLETLRRTAARLLGTGTVSGGGTTAAVSPGSSGSSTPGSTGITVIDDSGNAIPGVTNLLLSGLGVAAESNGANSARVRLSGAVDSDVSVVLSGGGWVFRDLVTNPGFDFTVEAGRGIVNGRAVSWPQSTVTTTADNTLIFIDSLGKLRTRVIGNPEAIPITDELPLWRSYVDVALYGARIYAVIEGRTYARSEPRGMIHLEQFVEDCVVASGTYAGGVRVHYNAGSMINFYFANIGLMPFVETMPSVVLGHLNLQIALFYSSATGTGATNWTALHGTAHSGYVNWPYDVIDPTGTPVKIRADSHDSYAATFLELAVRYAKNASGGLAWWDANYSSIINCWYNNLIIRQQFVGSGYMQQTFQDLAVYPYLQTMDNMECWRALKSTFDLMATRGGTQASDAAFYSAWNAQLLAGLQSMWVTGVPNAKGETDWLSIAYDTTGGGSRLVNQLSNWYPEIAAHYMRWWGDVPFSSTTATERAIENLMLSKFAKVPQWHRSRKYDLFPWGFTAFCATRAGQRYLGEQWLDYVQRHHTVDAIGYLQINDIGFAYGVQRLLQGEKLYWG